MPTTHEQLRRGLLSTLALTAVASTAVATLGVGGASSTSVPADSSGQEPARAAAPDQSPSGKSPSGKGRTEYAEATVRSLAFWL